MNGFDSNKTDTLLNLEMQNRFEWFDEYFLTVLGIMSDSDSDPGYGFDDEDTKYANVSY